MPGGARRWRSGITSVILALVEWHAHGAQSAPQAGQSTESGVEPKIVPTNLTLNNDFLPSTFDKSENVLFIFYSPEYIYDCDWCVKSERCQMVRRTIFEVVYRHLPYSQTKLTYL